MEREIEKTSEWLGSTGSFLFLWPIYAVAGMWAGLKFGWKELHGEGDK